MEWYYSQNNEQRGPTSAGRILELNEAGLLGSDALIWRQDYSEWKPLSAAEADLRADRVGSSHRPSSSAGAEDESPYQTPATAFEGMDLPDPNDPFRARGIGALFTQSFAILRERFGILLTVFLTIWAPLNFAINYILYSEHPDYGSQETLTDADMLVFRLQQAAQGFVGIIATAAVLTICLRAWEREKIGYGEAIGEGIRNWGRFFLTNLLGGLAVVVGLILLVLPGLYIAVRLSLTGPIIICEQEYGTGALKSSWELTRNRFWGTTGRLLLGLCPLIGGGIVIGILYAVIPAGETWIGSSIFDCAIAPFEVFFTVFMFVIYQHWASDPPAPVVGR